MHAKFKRDPLYFIVGLEGEGIETHSHVEALLDEHQERHPKGSASDERTDTALCRKKGIELSNLILVQSSATV